VSRFFVTVARPDGSFEDRVVDDPAETILVPAADGTIIMAGLLAKSEAMRDVWPGVVAERGGGTGSGT